MMVIIVVSFFVTTAGLFLGLMLMGLILEAWPLFMVIGSLLIIRDMVKQRSLHDPVARRSKV